MTQFFRCFLSTGGCGQNLVACASRGNKTSERSTSQLCARLRPPSPGRRRLRKRHRPERDRAAAASAYRAHCRHCRPGRKPLQTRAALKEQVKVVKFCHHPKVQSFNPVNQILLFCHVHASPAWNKFLVGACSVCHSASNPYRKCSPSHHCVLDKQRLEVNSSWNHLVTYLQTYGHSGRKWMVIILVGKKAGWKEDAKKSVAKSMLYTWSVFCLATRS